MEGNVDLFLQEAYLIMSDFFYGDSNTFFFFFFKI